MSDGYTDPEKSRDLRRIEWTTRVLRGLGDIISEWEDCRGASWIELDVAAGTAILRSSATAFAHTLLTVAARLQAESGSGVDDAAPLSALLDELVEAYDRLGGEIVRHAIAAGLAADRLRVGGGSR
jgi:hypothetical protein